MRVDHQKIWKIFHTFCYSLIIITRRNKKLFRNTRLVMSSYFKQVNKFLREIPNMWHVYDAGHDGISNRELTTCDLVIIKPFSINLGNCVNQSASLDAWKKLPICRIHNMLISPMHICGKVFERQIFNSLFEYFEDNNFLSAQKCDFPTDDFCVYHPLSIVCIALKFAELLKYIFNA